MRRILVVALAGLGLAGATTLLVAEPAAAHVVPATTVALDVHETDITAELTLPADDLATASGVAIGDALSDAEAAALAAYLEQHVAVTSDGDAWTVEASGLALAQAEQWGTGTFDAVTATLTLTPAAASELRDFRLAYDAIIHQVVTADIVVTLHSDWAAGELDSARELGTITVDTVTGEVAALAVDLDDGSPWQGFLGMVALGVAHITEGTDHQLFLLTLLLPAPLLAASGRWRSPAGGRVAVRRITSITIAFTLGHSVTLALGALGLPVPQQPIEALIAVSILVAAVHAVRPLFPGREALVAGLFGLVHGMAFSTTLTELDLSGGQLVLSLLGFNLGIELMQLAVVLLVLPPLVVLARTGVYRPLRIGAAVVTGVAATGWLVDRLGMPNTVGTMADALGTAAPWIVAALWLGAGATLVRAQAGRGRAPSASEMPRAAMRTPSAN